MKRAVLGGTVVALLLAVLGLASSPPMFLDPLIIKIEERNPWTNLKLNNAKEHFQFVIVSDRTGGHRAKVFSRAVEQINLLQPEFVLSVGDLIEGGKQDPEPLAREWREFQGYVEKLQMPFFYVAGNHDISNLFQEKLWQEKFGRRYYHFVYQNVLFLSLCSEDPPGTGKISQAQIDFVKKALEENSQVRWTIALVHKPLWAHSDLKTNGWLEVENLLKGRKYTVFAGHVHRYEKFVRNGMNYYQLATTGGSSKMRGIRYSEFDHIVWVTMKNDGPVIANLLVDGILGADLGRPDSDEQGTPVKRRATHPLQGKVYLDGMPAAGSTIALYQINEKTKRSTRVSDSLIDADGSFVMGTYGLGDGAPEGDYTATVSNNPDYGDKEDRARRRPVPTRYSSIKTSPLRLNVLPGPNTVTLELKSQGP